jgi:hypothetical protein
MCPEQHRFLSLRNFPARLSAQEAAWVLGFRLHEIPVLVRGKLLRPLGRPAPNGCKYFATTTLQKLAQDEKFLSRATEHMAVHWQTKKASRAESENLSSDS